ncbi:hypothetical protein ACUOCP_49635, partial [Escherichia sp. R-CC3]
GWICRPIAVNIGCHLTIPQSCEFQQLRDKQEA